MTEWPENPPTYCPILRLRNGRRSARTPAITVLWRRLCDDRPSEKKGPGCRDCTTQNSMRSLFSPLDNDIPDSKISIATGVSKTIVGELKECLRPNDNAGIENLLASKGPGRNTALTQEEAMIVKRIVFAAECDFAIDHDKKTHHVPYCIRCKEGMESRHTL